MDMLICVAGPRPDTESGLRAIVTATGHERRLEEGFGYTALAYRPYFSDQYKGFLHLSFPEAPGGPVYFVSCNPLVTIKQQ